MHRTVGRHVERQDCRLWERGHSMLRGIPHEPVESLLFCMPPPLLLLDFSCASLQRSKGGPEDEESDGENNVQWWQTRKRQRDGDMCSITLHIPHQQARSCKLQARVMHWDDGCGWKCMRETDRGRNWCQKQERKRGTEHEHKGREVFRSDNS